MNVNATLSAQQVATTISVQRVGAALSGSPVDVAFSSQSTQSFSGPNALSSTTVAGHKSIAFDTVTVFTDVSYDSIEYSNFKVVSRHSWFGRFDFPIAAGSTITSATLRLVTTTGGDANALTARFWLVPKDGIWDNAGPNLSWVVLNDTTGATTEAWGIQALMQTAGGGANLSSGPGLGSNDLNVKYDWGAVITDQSGIDSVAQTLVCTTSGNFRRYQMRLLKIGTPAGNCRIKMYRAMADDGTDDRPNLGALLATSPDIAASSVVNGLFSFDFSSDVAVTAGLRYAFALEVDHVYTNTDYLRTQALLVDSYAGSACIFGKRYGVATCAYGVGPMWPHLYREDGTTPHKPAFGSVLEYALNTTWTGNQDFDVTTLVQQWVAGAGNAPGTILFGIQPKDNSFLGVRRFTSAQLLVSGFKNVSNASGAVTAQRFNVVLTVG